MSLLRNFPDKCFIGETVLTKEVGGLGVAIAKIQTRLSDVECWVQPSASREIRGFKRREFKDVRMIYFVVDPDVTSNSVIVVTERSGVAVPTSEQIILDVIGFPQPDSSAGFGIVWRAAAASTSGNSYSVDQVTVLP